jgi:tetratricopeptide (TPR) repeat protein
MRRAILAGIVVVAALSVADYLAWRTSHTRLVGLAGSSGLTRLRPEIVGQLRQRVLPTRAATALAWNLLDLEVDRDWLARLPAAQRQEEDRRGLDRLRLATGLAEEVLAHQPGSWRALAVLGAGRFLTAGRAGQRDQAESTWRQPLAAAMRLAPNAPEPPLLLAAIELSRWSSLSRRQQRAALPLLTRAFEARRGLQLLLPTWVRLAPSLSSLLEAIPDRSPAWKQLAAEFLRTGDLERFAMARRRWMESLPAFLADRVDSARAHLDGGDPRGVFGLLGPVLEAPHDRALAHSFSAALALLPDEVAGGRDRAHLYRWLAWALDLCVLETCPLDSDTLARLSRTIGDLDEVERALAALAADDLATARRLEPAAAAGEDPDWNRYWIYKAARLAQHEPDEARQTLSRVVRQAADELRYWSARERLAAATGDAEDLRRARRSLRELERSSWLPEHWTRRGSWYRLEIATAAEADGLRLDIGSTRAVDAAVDLYLDGRALGTVALGRGQYHRYHVAVAAGLHLVEVANASGRPLLPARLSLVATTAAD